MKQSLLIILNTPERWRLILKEGEDYSCHHHLELFSLLGTDRDFLHSIAYILDQQYIEAHVAQIEKTDKEIRTHHSIALQIGYVF